MSHPNKFFILKFFHVKKPLHTIQKTVGESSLFLFINLISKTSLSIISCHFLSFLDLSCHFVLFLVIWWERTQGFPRDFGNRWGGDQGGQKSPKTAWKRKNWAFWGFPTGRDSGGDNSFSKFWGWGHGRQGGIPPSPCRENPVTRPDVVEFQLPELSYGTYCCRSKIGPNSVLSIAEDDQIGWEH